MFSFINFINNDFSTILFSIDTNDSFIFSIELFDFKYIKYVFNVELNIGLKKIL